MNIVKELRIQAGLQQKEVALAIGVSNPTVSEWEHQKKDPSGERLNKLADLFNVSPETILGINLSSIVSKFPNAYPMPAQNHLPIYGAIKCGPGGLAMEELLGYAESVKDPATHFCLMCYGDSMLPEFKDGDIVVNKFSRYLQVVSRRLKAGCMVYLYSAHIAKRLVSWSWVLLGIGSN